MRVDKLQQAFAVDVVYRHFPLHPDTPEDGLTLEALFAGRNIDIPAAQERMTRLMAEEGLPYGNRTMTYNSRLAQELAMWAETQPTGEKVHDALFQAYFADNVNLAKIENLITIAAAIGLPADEHAASWKSAATEKRSMPIGNDRTCWALPACRRLWLEIKGSSARSRTSN